VDDLQRAVDLDGDAPDPLALNNLGNAKGALNRWDEAMADFLEASRVEDMRAIAQANYALAAFQIGRVDLAIATAKKLLRKDPEYLDMRALLSAMYWSEGIVDLAESEWTYLCKSGRGFGAKRSAEDVRGDDPTSDLRYASTLLSQQFAQQFAELTGGVKEAGLDTPCRLYKTTDTVANRWPPRATAALDAFLRVRNYGEALDYDGRVKRFDFNF
jgi:tetratricopeptide (TPR) repeat protein